MTAVSKDFTIGSVLYPYESLFCKFAKSLEPQSKVSPLDHPVSLSCNVFQVDATARSIEGRVDEAPEEIEGEKMPGFLKAILCGQQHVKVI